MKAFAGIKRNIRNVSKKIANKQLQPHQLTLLQLIILTIYIATENRAHTIIKSC